MVHPPYGLEHALYLWYTPPYRLDHALYLWYTPPTDWTTPCSCGTPPLRTGPRPVVLVHPAYGLDHAL